jgi:hypothetical protein
MRRQTQQTKAAKQDFASRDKEEEEEEEAPADTKKKNWLKLDSRILIRLTAAADRKTALFIRRGHYYSAT